MIKWMKLGMLIVVSVFVVACESNTVSNNQVLECTKASSGDTSDVIRINYSSTEITYYVDSGTVLLDSSQSIGDTVLTDITDQFAGDHFAFIEQVKADAEDDDYQCEYQSIYASRKK